MQAQLRNVLEYETSTHQQQSILSEQFYILIFQFSELGDVTFQRNVQHGTLAWL